MSNYIPDTNRFKLAGPPLWWLKRLWDFDDSLVVIPSRQNCVYRLAQRRIPNLPIKMVNDILFQDSDTQMLASYHLIPVTTILATANWSNPYLFVELANRAPHRLGGAEAVNRMLDEQEQREMLDKRQKEEDDLNYLAKDGWRYYNKKVGLRSHLWSPTTSPPKSEKFQRAPAIITSSGFVG